MNNLERTPSARSEKIEPSCAALEYSICEFVELNSKCNYTIEDDFFGMCSQDCAQFAFHIFLLVD